MTPNTYIFDLFGVVISFDDQIVYRRIAEHCPQADAALRELDGLVSSPSLITGKLALHELHRQLCQSHGLRLSVDEFDALWREPYSESMDGMDAVLRALGRNHRLVLLSNVDQYYWTTVRQLHPELVHFDAVLLSCELGLAKPDSRVFARAAETAGVDPSECYFVDDKLENVKAAQASGFGAHLFESVSGLRSALRGAGASGF
jgi:HAD superfamily hydrolase (TIGR01509 family)